MSAYPESMTRLIKELSRLPGIGPKSAERIVFFLLKESSEKSKALAGAISEARTRVRFCERCRNLSDEEICSICRDPGRNAKALCVVEDPKDVGLIEKTGMFHGLYHVLLGAISPLDGIGPEELRLGDLLTRVKNERIEEVILATGAGLEGDATALYLARLLKPMGVRITRIARGLPVGSPIEFADPATLARALEGRTQI